MGNSCSDRLHAAGARCTTMDLESGLDSEDEETLLLEQGEKKKDEKEDKPDENMDRMVQMLGIFIGVCGGLILLIFLYKKYKLYFGDDDGPDSFEATHHEELAYRPPVEYVKPPEAAHHSHHHDRA